MRVLNHEIFDNVCEAYLQNISEQADRLDDEIIRDLNSCKNVHAVCDEQTRYAMDGHPDDLCSIRTAIRATFHIAFSIGRLYEQHLKARSN